MDKIKKNERGQAMYLIVFGIVALLGFAALSIDGGHIFAERRKAQNAADTAAYAAALAIIDNTSGSDATAADNAGHTAADDNGYDDNGTTNTVDVTFPFTYNGDNDHVKVEIWTEVETSLIQFVYSGDVSVSVEAVVHVVDVDADVMGNAIITLGSCSDGPLLDITGGGNSGGIEAYNGGMFLNDPGGGCCAMDSSTSTGGVGIFTDTGITGVGGNDFTGCSVGAIEPLPVDGGFNAGKPIQDPLYFLAEPECSPSNAYVFNITNKSQLTGGTLSPGIYCITGDIHLSGSETIVGTGVLLYFINGDLDFTGGSGMEITAPTSGDCYQDGDGILETNESCKYEGMAIFVSRSNTGTISVKGNGGSAVTGLIYAPFATVQASGGGSDPTETNVTGQIIAAHLLGNGNGSLIVEFDNTFTYTAPPMLDLVK